MMNKPILITGATSGIGQATIAGTRKPRFRYNLAVDAKLVDGIVTRLLPFRARAAINRRMYRLDEPAAQLKSAMAVAMKPVDETAGSVHPDREVLSAALPQLDRTPVAHRTHLTQ